MICLPVMIISVSFNIAMRSSATYDYNFSSTEILSKMTVSIDQKELADLFGDYMKHRTDTFQLKQNVEYNPQDVFSEKDQAYMHNIRKITDIVAMAGIPATVVTVFAYWLLIRWRRREVIRSFFIRGAWIFVVMTAVLSLCKFITPLYKVIIEPVKGTGVEAGDALITIFGAGFHRTELMFELIISLIFFGVMAYITHEVAGRKKIFSGFGGY